MPEHRTLSSAQRTAIRCLVESLPEPQERHYGRAFTDWVDGLRESIPACADYKLSEQRRDQIDGAIYAVKRTLAQQTGKCPNCRAGDGEGECLCAEVEPQQPSNATARLVDGVTTCECGSTTFEVAEHGARREQLANAAGVVRFGPVELDDSDYVCTACGRTVALQSVATVEVVQPYLDPKDDPVFAWSVANAERAQREWIEEQRDALLRAASVVLDGLPGGAAAQRRGGGTFARLADERRPDMALIDALDAVGAELTEFATCEHQGVLISWERRPRRGETFLGLQVADPVSSEVIERHFVPHDQIPVSDEVMAVTRARALQRAIWDLEDDARCASQDGTEAAR